MADIAPVYTAQVFPWSYFSIPIPRLNNLWNLVCVLCSRLKLYWLLERERKWEKQTLGCLETNMFIMRECDTKRKIVSVRSGRLHPLQSGWKTTQGSRTSRPGNPKERLKLHRDVAEERMKRQGNFFLFFFISKLALSKASSCENGLPRL